MRTRMRLALIGALAGRRYDPPREATCSHVAPPWPPQPPALNAASTPTGTPAPQHSTGVPGRAAYTHPHSSPPDPQAARLLPWLPAPLLRTSSSGCCAACTAAPLVCVSQGKSGCLRAYHGTSAARASPRLASRHGDALARTDACTVLSSCWPSSRQEEGSRGRQPCMGG